MFDLCFEYDPTTRREYDGYDSDSWYDDGFSYYDGVSYYDGSSC